jgi:hypothetical protein
MSIFKKYVIALAMAFSGFGASAADVIPVGTFAGTYANTQFVSGDFDYLYTFTLPAGVSQLKQSIVGLDYLTGEASDFSAEFSFGSGTGPTSASAYSQLSFTGIVDGVRTYSDTGILSALDGATSYWVNVRGYGSVAQYTLNLSTAPVPEPETYAMLLAGLGLMGVVARRRKNSGAL